MAQAVKILVRLGLLAPIVALQFSCQVPHEEPTGAGLASIEFVNNSKLPMSQFVYRDAAECTGRLTVGELLPPGGLRKTNVSPGETAIQVGADSPTLYTLHGTVVSGCVIPISFQAGKAKRYRLALRIANDVCSIEFTETAMDGRETPAPFDEREFVAPLTPSGAFCRATRIHHAGVVVPAT